MSSKYEVVTINGERSIVSATLARAIREIQAVADEQAQKVKPTEPSNQELFEQLQCIERQIAVLREAIYKL